MALLQRRVQVLFDPDQYASLERLAVHERRSVGALIREAVDLRLEKPQAENRAALDRLLESADSEPPAEDWATIKNSFEAAPFISERP